MNINFAVDKAFEGKTLKELANSPIHALQGLTPADGELLQKAMGVKTIGDLGSNKFVRWAQAIAILAEKEQ